MPRFAAAMLGEIHYMEHQQVPARNLFSLNFRQDFGCGSDVARTWLGLGSDVAWTWLGHRSDVFADVVGTFLVEVKGKRFPAGVPKSYPNLIFLGVEKGGKEGLKGKEGGRMREKAWEGRGPKYTRKTLILAPL